MDKELIIKAAKHCIETNGSCNECVFYKYCDKSRLCVHFFAEHILISEQRERLLEFAKEKVKDGFKKEYIKKASEQAPDPLLTRLDAEKPPEKIDRAYILDTAKKMVTGKREQDYGSPEDNFNVIGKYWSIYKGIDFSAEDVAIMMAFLKTARIQTGTATIDSWIDLAGYAACGGEIACKQKAIEVES